MARRTAAALGALLVIGCTRAPQPPPPVSPNRAPIRVSVWLERPAIDTPVFRVNLGQQSVEVRAREPSSVPAATVVAGVPLGDRPVRAAAGPVIIFELEHIEGRRRPADWQVRALRFRDRGVKTPEF